MKVQISPLQVSITVTAFYLEALKLYLQIINKKVRDDYGFSINTENPIKEGDSYTLSITLICSNNDIDKFTKAQQYLMSLLAKVDNVISTAKTSLASD